jgi:hypothetical protein
MAKEKEGTIMNQPCTFLDVMPTCLELAGSTYPSFYGGNKIKPLCDEARSFVPLLQEKNKWDDERTLYWEHENGKAVRKGNWRLTALANGGWQLFDLEHDLSETNNLAAEYPDKVREMKTLWNTWARSVGLNVPAEIKETKTELIFHYPFDGNLDDASPRNYVLTPSANGVTFGTGKLGNALHLNGNAQYVDLNTNGIFNTQTTQTTFCAWVYNENTAAPGAGSQSENGVYIRDEIILAQKDNEGTGRIYLYARAEAPTGGGATDFFYNSFLGGSQHRATAGSSKPGTWQHVAIVCNPVDQSITYFVNGERDCTVSVGSFEACTGGFRIGGHKTGKSYFKGYIDDAWFFKGALSAEQIRQIRDNTFDPTPYLSDGSTDDPTLENWPLKDQAYTIRNFSGTAAYMVDNMESDNRISCEGKVGEAAYWTFEPTINTHCYHIRNVQTGRYIQGYEKTSGTIISMGIEGIEYRVAAQATEGGRYGFACTSVTPNDFSSGTIGLNLRGESNQANCLVQTYAATAGTNHRSFWTLEEVSDDIITSLVPGATLNDKGQKISDKWSYGRWFDLQGRPVNEKYIMNHRQLIIDNGKKIIKN